MATFAWMAKMRKPQKFSTRFRNRCQICGRPRAYYRDFGDRNTELYTMNRSGSERVRLTNTARAERWPSWSPDGQQIAYVAWTPNERTPCGLVRQSALRLPPLRFVTCGP